MRRRSTGRLTTRRTAGLTTALLLGLGALSACGNDDGAHGAGESASQHAGEHDGGERSGEESEQEMETAADRSVCKADADPVDKPYADGFPDAWTFPPETTVYDVEDRGETGVIVTGVSSLPFQQILDYLNKDAVAAGFKVTEGETEDHDAEANWDSGDQQGRWAIRESADCPGETVVQVYAAGR